MPNKIRLTSLSFHLFCYKMQRKKYHDGSCSGQTEHSTLMYMHLQQKSAHCPTLCCQHQDLGYMCHLNSVDLRSGMETLEMVQHGYG